MKTDVFVKHYTPIAGCIKVGKAIFSIKDFGQGHNVIVTLVS